MIHSISRIFVLPIYVALKLSWPLYDWIEKNERHSFHSVYFIYMLCRDKALPRYERDYED